MVSLISSRIIRPDIDCQYLPPFAAGARPPSVVCEYRDGGGGDDWRGALFQSMNAVFPSQRRKTIKSFRVCEGIV